MIEFKYTDVVLYDGDTETESGEAHKVLSIDETGAHMDNGETWCYGDLSDYEFGILSKSLEHELQKLTEQ
jgi:hypothetical protein